MQLSLVVILALALPVLSATCPKSQFALPNPGKCFECQGVENFHFTQKDPAIINGQGNSWTDFTCGYVRRITRSDWSTAQYRHEGEKEGPDTRVFRLTCRYNDKGKLVEGTRKVAGGTCPSQATPIKNCEPLKEPRYDGDYETCCKPDCKLETDNCFHCPKHDGMVWVETTIASNVLQCRYRFNAHSGQVTDCSFDATTGKLMSGTSCPPHVLAPQRASCLEKNPTVKKATPEAHPYLLCPKEGPCHTKSCYTCPRFPKSVPSDAVRGFEFNYNGPMSARFHCEYFNHGQYFGRCKYDLFNGKLIHKPAGEKPSDSRCAPQAVKAPNCKPA